MANTSSTLSSPPQLSEDILHIVAQKMLFTKQEQGDKSFASYKIDLRHQNGFTSFMAVNPITRNIFLTQFMKMKDIEFNGICPHIQMFKDKNRRWKSDSKEFYGPYLVTKAFIGFLIDFGKLNLSSIRAFCYFGENGIFANKKPCKLAIQSFCNLFLNKEMSNEDASKIHFELDHLDVEEGNNLLGSIFEELLNLNAKEVVISLTDPKLFDCSLFARTAVANRTQKFALKLNFSNGYEVQLNDLKSNWQGLISVLLLVCPEIRQIELKIFYQLRPEECIKEFVTHLDEMVDLFVQQIFPNLSEGNSNAQINVLLELNCDTDQYEELLPSDYELFEKGHEVEVEVKLDYAETHNARECQVVDKLGRTHNCEFRISAREVSYDSEMQQDMLDDYEADFYADADDYEEYEGNDDDYDYEDGAYGSDYEY